MSSDLSNISNNNWFTPVSNQIAESIVSASASVGNYEKSPYRTCNTYKSPFFTWLPLNADKNNSIPEITDNVVALRGFILYYGTSLNLYDSTNKQMICSTTQATVGYNEQGVPITRKGSFCSPKTMYNPEAYSEDPNARPQPNSILQNFKLKGSRGSYCSDCVLNGEHISQTINDKNQPIVEKCSASNSIIFYVQEFGIVEPQADNTYGVTWYNYKTYLTRSGKQVISEPFILDIRITKGQATKRIGPKFQVNVQPNSLVPKEVVTYTTYLDQIHNPTNPEFNVVKVQDPNWFKTDYINLLNVGTEIWAAGVPDTYKNQMINCWPVFRNTDIANIQQYNDLINEAFTTLALTHKNLESDSKNNLDSSSLNTTENTLKLQEYEAPKDTGKKPSSTIGKTQDIDLDIFKS